MRVLLQRVSQGKVTVDGAVVGEIERGLLLLVGVTHGDGAVEAEWMARKIAGIRVFDDADGKMNLGIHDVNGRILVISQFTLYGDGKKGRRPSYINAARPEQAEPLVEHFVEKLRSTYNLHVETGIFGANMQVELVNDGPVTLLLEK